MRRTHQNLLDKLYSYRRNMEFYLTLVDLTDEEYYECRRADPPNSRVGEETLLAWLRRTNKLIGYIEQRIEAGDTQTLDMLCSLRSLTSLELHEDFAQYDPILIKAAALKHRQREAATVTRKRIGQSNKNRDSEIIRRWKKLESKGFAGNKAQRIETDMRSADWKVSESTIRNVLKKTQKK